MRLVSQKKKKKMDETNSIWFTQLVLSTKYEYEFNENYMYITKYVFSRRNKTIYTLHATLCNICIEFAVKLLHVLQTYIITLNKTNRKWIYKFSYVDMIKIKWH